MIRTLASRALDLVFPPRCVGCGAFDGAFLCAECFSAIPRADGRRCDRCWTIASSAACPRCADFPKAFAGMRSTFSYGGPARDAVLNLKFLGVSAVADVMAREMNQTWREWGLDVGAIVPIPLGWVRRRTRGYNQAELLARSIGRANDIPLLTDAVKRSRQTKPQAMQPDAESRRRNVEGAFAPTGKAVPPRVLLIDDVATTGATLDACTRALLEGGAQRVYCLTFARED